MCFDNYARDGSRNATAHVNHPLLLSNFSQNWNSLTILSKLPIILVSYEILMAQKTRLAQIFKNTNQKIKKVCGHLD